MVSISTSAVLALILWTAPAFGTVVELPAARDNTLYEVAPDSAASSNAGGELMFCGMSGVGDIRRAIVAFDLTSIPPGSVIESATLTLYNVLSRANEVPVGLHRVLADWGDGTSKAESEGRGAPATAGDVTWLHRFFPDTPWSNSGGDYAGVPSAAQSAPSAGYHSWNGAGLARDVQTWVNDPASNFGWVLIGDESSLRSMKRFATSENGVSERRPVLTVEYTSPVSAEYRTWGTIKAQYR